MDPITIALLAQGGMGLYQMLKGQSEASKLQRPTYQIPEEIKAKLSDAQRRTIEGLPEASKKLFVDNMQRASAMGLRNLSTRQAGIQGLAGIADVQAQQGRQLAASDAAQRIASQEAIRGAIGAAQSEMAGYKDRVFADQLQKYQQEAQAAQALTGAGLQNIAGALQGGIGAMGQKGYTDAIKGLGQTGTDNTKQILDAIKGMAPAATNAAAASLAKPAMGTGSYAEMGPNLPGVTAPAATVAPTTPSTLGSMVQPVQTTVMPTEQLAQGNLSNYAIPSAGLGGLGLSAIQGQQMTGLQPTGTSMFGGMDKQAIRMLLKQQGKTDQEIDNYLLNQQ